MLSGRTYVVTSPSLAVAIQRASATLDFDQLVVEMTPRLCGLSPETKALLEDPTAKQEGRVRMVTRQHDIVTPALAGHRIHEVTEVQVKHFSDFINKVKDGQEVELFKFLTREVTAASTYTFYGPHNPFALDPSLIEKFWDWDYGAVGYAVGVLPKITARKAYYGAEAVIKGFLEYTKQGLHREAIPFLHERRKLHEAEGISITEHARLELPFTMAIVSNASITSFWVINNIFSRPSLLTQVREEISQNALLSPSSSPATKQTISVLSLRDKCPLLNSIYRETLRLIAPMTSARIVLEDTLLQSTYLLRKGNVVQIAGGVLHSDTDIWGPDASSFNPRRFFYSASGSKAAADGSVSDAKASVAHPAAFRAFGGGVSLCPGRHFAQLEVLSLAAGVVMGFELKPVQGGGRGEVGWDPRRDDKRFPLALTKPLREVWVGVERRGEVELVL